jgi:uncharacterized membrane protein YjdF
MDDDRKSVLALLFTGCYLLFFGVYAIFRSNIEFVYYGAVIFIVFLLLVKYRKRLQISFSSVMGLSIVELAHILGGNIVINNIRLYDIWLIDNVFRYDNFVHIIAPVVVALVLFEMLKHYLHEKILYNRTILCCLIILMVCGIGALNEVMEFGAVIFFDAKDRVGDYTNNAFDLVYNLLGSIIGAVYIITRKEFKKEYAAANKNTAAGQR